MGWRSDAYINAIIQLLRLGQIRTPNKLENLVTFSRGPDGRLLGWIVKNKRIFLSQSPGFAACDEIAKVKGLLFTIQHRKYHYEPPGDDENLLQFRIDDNSRGVVHANPDARTGLPRHMTSDQCGLELSKFNLVSFVFVVQKYTSTKKYPLESKWAAEYSAILELVDRGISGCRSVQ